MGKAPVIDIASRRRLRDQERILNPDNGQIRTEEEAAPAEAQPTPRPAPIRAADRTFD
jgi:hypothetical protein